MRNKTSLLLGVWLASGCGAVEPPPDPERALIAKASAHLDTGAVSRMRQAFVEAEAALRQAGIAYPTPTETIPMGGFAGGVFTGLTHEVEPNPYGKDLITYPTVSVSAVEAQLQFDVTPGQSASVTLTWLEQNEVGETEPRQATFTSAPGAAALMATTRRGRTLTWTFREGSRVYSDKLHLDRPAEVGRFSVPALPLAIVYAPPQPRGGSASTRLDVRSTIGSAVSVEVTRSVSEQVFDDAFISGKESFKGTLGSAKSLAALGGRDNIAKILGNLSDALGKETTQVTDGDDHTTKRRYQNVVTTGGWFETQPTEGGPGMGDVFAVATDVEVGWLLADGRVSMTILGWGGELRLSAKRLREELSRIEHPVYQKVCWGFPRRCSQVLTNPPTLGLDGATLTALLGLDPFVAIGEHASPSDIAVVHPLRFQGCFENMIIGGASTGGSRTVSSQTQITDAHTRYRVIAREYTPGLMAWLGVEPSEQEKISITTRHARIKDDWEGRELTSSWRATAPGEAINVYGCIDGLWGTYLLGSQP